MQVKSLLPFQSYCGFCRHVDTVINTTTSKKNIQNSLHNLHHHRSSWQNFNLKNLKTPMRDGWAEHLNPLFNLWASTGKSELHW